MKRTMILLAMTAAVGGSVSALVGPTTDLEPRRGSAAFEVSTFKRDVRIRGSVGPSIIAPNTIEMSENLYALRGTYALSRNFSAYALLGMGRGNLGTFSFPSGLGTVAMRGDHSLLWGVGADYALMTRAIAPDLSLGLSGEYRTFTSGVAGGDLEMDEFRIALKGAYQLERMRPYGGLLFSYAKGRFTGLTTATNQVAGSLESDDRFGFFAGMEYAFTDRLKGRLEAELISSTAANASIAYEFGGAAPDRGTYVPAPARPVEPVRSEAEPEVTAPSTRRREDRRTGADAPARRTGGAMEEEAEAQPAPPPPSAPKAPAVTVQDAGRAEEQVRLGNEMTALGRHDEAQTHYRRAIALNPRHVKAHYNLATVLYLSRDYAGARAEYEEVTRLDPLDAQAHLYMGFCHYRMADLDAAARAWKRVLELEPGNSVALNNLQAIRR